jgi:hypothetical protein
MRNPAITMRHLIAMLAALAMAFSLSSCAETDVEETDPVANGVNADIGPVQVRSLLIVTAAEGQPGRLLGTLSNTAEEPTEVTITDANSEVTVTVDGGTDYGFDTNAHQLPTVTEPPGSRVPVTVTVRSESTELLVPVFDGTLEPYRQYLPPGAPSPNASEPASGTPSP